MTILFVFTIIHSTELVEKLGNKTPITIVLTFNMSGPWIKTIFCNVVTFINNTHVHQLIYISSFLLRISILIKKLESTQRAFTRQGLSYWDRLKKLGLMSLQRRVILHLWKIWQGAVPNDLDIQFYDHTRLGTRCKIPAIKRNSTTLSRSIYDHSFAVRGPKLWNAKNIKFAPSFEDFKSKLTSHLMSIIPDLPPVPGYTTPNSNSILDWNAGGLQQVA